MIARGCTQQKSTMHSFVLERDIIASISLSNADRPAEKRKKEQTGSREGERGKKERGKASVPEDMSNLEDEGRHLHLPYTGGTKLCG